MITQGRWEKGKIEKGKGELCEKSLVWLSLYLALCHERPQTVLIKDFGGLGNMVVYVW